MLVVAACAGCPTLFSPVEGGRLEGSVLFGGRSAAGKVVTLQRQTDGGISTVPGPDGQALEARTTATGAYRFSGLSPGDYRVIYVSGRVPDGRGISLVRGEVGTWTTRWRSVTAREGARLAPFDVEYNGPLYPTDSKYAYLLAKDLPIPFHWSTHRLGQKYRLKIFAGPSGLGGDLLTSDWIYSPAMVVARDVRTGKYSWSVVIDGGEAGEGTSAPREIDLSDPGMKEAE